MSWKSRLWWDLSLPVPDMPLCWYIKHEGKLKSLAIILSITFMVLVDAEKPGSDSKWVFLAAIAIWGPILGLVMHGARCGNSYVHEWFVSRGGFYHTRRKPRLRPLLWETLFWGPVSSMYLLDLIHYFS